jgi:anthranilate synthase/aminodeoxychorismate synthase-like glutamine amidotransferase
MKVLLIDHDDSFTFNLQSWLRTCFHDVNVVGHNSISNSFANNDSSSYASGHDLVVLSPGPKGPGDYPHIQKFLKTLSHDQYVFGVCLGLQSMVYALGGKVETYFPPKHGKTSRLRSLSKNYDWLENLSVARYHSLKCSGFENQFVCRAQTQDDGLPMWLSAKEKNWIGVQFHPESFLTENSDLILAHILKWAKK